MFITSDASTTGLFGDENGVTNESLECYNFYRELQGKKHQNLLLFRKILNIKKKQAAAKKEAGGDEKLLYFFTWPKGLCSVMVSE